MGFCTRPRRRARVPRWVGPTCTHRALVLHVPGRVWAPAGRRETGPELSSSCLRFQPVLAEPLAAGSSGTLEVRLEADASRTSVPLASSDSPRRRDGSAHQLLDRRCTAGRPEVLPPGGRMWYRNEAGSSSSGLLSVPGPHLVKNTWRVGLGGVGG